MRYVLYSSHFYCWVARLNRGEVETPTLFVNARFTDRKTQAMRFGSAKDGAAYMSSHLKAYEPGCFELQRLVSDKSAEEIELEKAKRKAKAKAKKAEK